MLPYTASLRRLDAKRSMQTIDEIAFEAAKELEWRDIG